MPSTHETQKHETVGRVFKAFGDLYRCTRYARASGFYMRLVSKDPRGGSLFPGRQVGEEVCVSERAIGRTYYRDDMDEGYEAHAEGCECKCCKS